MRFYGSETDWSGLWFGPALLGVALVLIGILLYVWPNLLQFIVATFFVAAGLGLIGTAWRLRRRVTLRPVDDEWRIDNDENARQ